MSKNIEKMLREIEAIQNASPAVRALASAPLARPLPSTKGHSMFADASELRATIASIRTIEAANPSIKRFPEPKLMTAKFASKKDLEAAKAHLATIAHLAPKTTATASAPRPRPIMTAPKAAPATASTTPLLDRMASMTPEGKATFYAANRTALRIEAERTISPKAIFTH